MVAQPHEQYAVGCPPPPRAQRPALPQDLPGAHDGQFVEAGWIKVHGGSPRTSLATLPSASEPEEVLPALAPIIRDETHWLAENAVNNRFPDPEKLFDSEAMVEFRRITTTQRNHAGRVQTALLIYGYSVEAENPSFAREVHSAVRGWGSIANFLGDETALDYLSTARFNLFRENVRRWGDGIFATSLGEVSAEEIGELTDTLMDDFFGSTTIRRAGK